MTDWQPRVVIMGAGGMGALFGTILADGGLPVTLVDISVDHVDTIRRDGLRVLGFGGDRTVRIDATTDAGEIAAADLVFFQCKGHGSAAAARASRHLMAGGALAISFQNGLGNEEIIAAEVGAENVLGGLTAVAANLVGPGVIRDFSRVPSTIGEMAGGVSERVSRIAASLTSAGLETQASDNIVRDIWKKLFANIATGAPSGIADLTVSGVFQIPELAAVSWRAMEEAVAVAEALGIPVEAEAARSTIRATTQPGGNGETKSSICLDLRNQRRTEVDFIYGSVIAHGRRQGVPTPTLEALYGVIKGIESTFPG